MQCCVQSVTHSMCSGIRVPMTVALYVLPNLCTPSANLRNLPMTLGCAVKTKVSDRYALYLS